MFNTKKHNPYIANRTPLNYLKGIILSAAGLGALGLFIISKFELQVHPSLVVKNPNLFLAIGILMLLTGLTSLSLRYAIAKASKNTQTLDSPLKSEYTEQNN